MGCGVRNRISPTAIATPASCITRNAGAEGGRDPGEGVREDAGDRHGRVGEARGRREEVGTTDVQTHGHRNRSGGGRSHHQEDHEEQSRGGHHLTDPLSGAIADGLGDLDRWEFEHEIGHDRPDDAATDLRGDVGGCLVFGPGTEGDIGDGHGRVEVCPRDRAHHEDECGETERGDHGGLEELEPGIARTEPLRGDTAPDDGDQEKRGPHELGDDTT